MVTSNRIKSGRKFGFWPNKSLFGSKRAYHDIAKGPERLKMFISNWRMLLEQFSPPTRDFSEIGTFGCQIFGQIWYDWTWPPTLKQTEWKIFFWSKLTSRPFLKIVLGFYHNPSLSLRQDIGSGRILTFLAVASRPAQIINQRISASDSHNT